MAELRTEEEQVEALKRWWKENGMALVAGVALAAAGIFGWNAWQDYQAGKAEAASMRYQQLIGLTAGNQLDEDAIVEARQLVVEINDEHGSTLYADLAKLIDARLAVAQDDLAAARGALEDVISQTDHDYVAGLARLRLARLQLADGEAEAALDTLASGVPEALAAQRAEVRGDAFVSLGRRDDAHQAWHEAMSLADEQDQPLYGIQLKLDNLGLDAPGTEDAGA